MKHPIKLASAGILAIVIFMMVAISSSLAQKSDQGAGQRETWYPAASRAAGSLAIDDATLKQTARAFVKVKEIAQREKSVINDAKDEAAKQKIAQEAKSEKLAVVKAEGLQPERYDQVLQIVQTDNDLQQKFFSYVGNSDNSSNKNL